MRKECTCQIALEKRVEALENKIPPTVRDGAWVAEGKVKERERAAFKRGMLRAAEIEPTGWRDPTSDEHNAWRIGVLDMKEAIRTAAEKGDGDAL